MRPAKDTIEIRFRSIINSSMLRKSSSNHQEQFQEDNLRPTEDKIFKSYKEELKRIWQNNAQDEKINLSTKNIRNQKVSQTQTSELQVKLFQRQHRKESFKKESIEKMPLNKPEFLEGATEMISSRPEPASKKINQNPQKIHKHLPSGNFQTSSDESDSSPFLENLFVDICEQIDNLCIENQDDGFKRGRRTVFKREFPRVMRPKQKKSINERKYYKPDEYKIFRQFSHPNKLLLSRKGNFHEWLNRSVTIERIKQFCFSRSQGITVAKITCTDGNMMKKMKGGRIQILSKQMKAINRNEIKRLELVNPIMMVYVYYSCNWVLYEWVYRYIPKLQAMYRENMSRGMMSRAIMTVPHSVTRNNKGISFYRSYDIHKSEICSTQGLYFFRQIKLEKPTLVLIEEPDSAGEKTEEDDFAVLQAAILSLHPFEDQSSSASSLPNKVSYQVKLEELEEVSIISQVQTHSTPKEISHQVKLEDTPMINGGQIRIEKKKKKKPEIINVDDSDEMEALRIASKKKPTPKSTSKSIPMSTPKPAELLDRAIHNGNTIICGVETSSVYSMQFQLPRCLHYQSVGPQRCLAADYIKIDEIECYCINDEFGAARRWLRDESQSSNESSYDY